MSTVGPYTWRADAAKNHIGEFELGGKKYAVTGNNVEQYVLLNASIIMTISSVDPENAYRAHIAMSDERRLAIIREASKVIKESRK